MDMSADASDAEVWLEILTAQVAPPLADELTDWLLSIADEINQGAEVVAEVYAKQASGSVFSLLLRHPAGAAEPPSSLGLRIAEQLSELGGVAHSVWLPVRGAHP